MLAVTIMKGHIENEILIEIDNVLEVEMDFILTTKHQIKNHINYSLQL